MLEALQGDGTMEVSAELHTLTPMQMNLARDFNKSCSLEALERSEKRPSARMQAGKTSPAWGNAIPAHSRSDEIDSLMDRMGEMDMEKMVSSFRGSCRDLLQKIHLDHLIQDSEG
ncbi:hypothetical protein ASZ90_010109 [hydrocarbon metagenome]|uniref:Uncharacterized protein n=1 Tax=hydrocarbon metagenome TaxID=938273 RepID=A0A0W8FHG5_9ZZZZ